VTVAVVAVMELLEGKLPAPSSLTVKDSLVLLKRRATSVIVE
jgi:hypothetical protein